MSVVLDANDSKYWRQRAVDCLREIDIMNLQGELAMDRIIFSMQLLALVLAKETDGRKTKKGSAGS